jgi:hypothetical protein
MSRRVLAARANGSLGGKQSSRNLTEEEREARARTGGLAVLGTFGRDYYTYLGSQSRKNPPVEKSKPKLSTASRRIAQMM